MWYVYILRCKDGSLYTGSTNDISRRISEHNSGKGGNYTKNHRPVEIIYQEIFQTRSKAQSREVQIKGWTRKKKLSLVFGNKASLRQLSKSRD